MPFAFVNPGDTTLVPDPCYPPYKGGTILAGGTPYIMPLVEENDFLPDLNKIDKAALKKAKIIYINYPNNPTAAVCEKRFFQDVVLFAKKYNLIVASDAAYSEIAFDDYKPGSFLKVEGAKETGVEFHSLSKTCNMTGWRIGFVCGNEKIIAGIAKVKSNVDSGVFNAVQMSGIAALDTTEKYLNRMNKVYEETEATIKKLHESFGDEKVYKDYKMLAQVQNQVKEKEQYLELLYRAYELKTSKR